jgi:hypothetical protein
MEAQLVLDVDVDADPLSDLDLIAAERASLAERMEDRASARRPRRCQCPRPFVDVEESDARCVKCGRAVVAGP